MLAAISAADYSGTATITLQQAWTHTNDGYGNHITKALVNVPTANSVVVVIVTNNTGMDPLTPTDDFGDSGTWTVAQSYVSALFGYSIHAWFKQVGTPSGGGKSVTVTSSSINDIIIQMAEYAVSAAGTWALDTQNSLVAQYGTTIDTGALTTTSAGIIVGSTLSVATPTLTGVGFASASSASFNGITTFVADKISTAAGLHNSTWSVAEENWSAGQFAIKFTP